ncbi:MAG: hypothetical protein AAB606_02320 [Patescibacteria group bacterium]
MLEQDENLEPRFKINKNRIGDTEKSDVPADFSPEKVIYIEIDDEITNVFDRLRHVRGKRIALVIPRRAVLFQSIVNLRILKKKILELEKEVTIVTTDMIGIQLAQKVGIPAIEKIFGKSPAVEEKIQPRVASARSEKPTRVSGDKISISEVIRPEKQASLVDSIFGRIKERLKKRRKGNDTRLVLVAPNKQALFTLILVSILLLLAIAYIALPGATIYLTPKSSILDPSFNVTFLNYDRYRTLLEDNDFDNVVVASYPVEPPPFSKKLMYNSTGKIFKGENARGIIKVINTSNAPWDLAVKTRFQTDDGLIFRTPIAVKVPKSTGNVPGKLDVNVVADEFDVNNQVIGARGNVGPTRFFLPGIKNEENKKKLYGESTSPMTGGVTQTVKMASKEDIAAAKEQAKLEILKEAPIEVKKYLEQQNLIKKTNLSLLTDKKVFKISNPSFTIQDNIVGAAMEKFEIIATYTATGLAFDREELVSALRERLFTRADPDKRILEVNDEDINFKFLEEDISAGRVRFTATMRAIQVYELDPEKENGHRFLKKITDHILGAKIDDALLYLQQQTDEIAKVEIKTWPMWAPTIPNIADNVKFEIVEDNESDSLH